MIFKPVITSRALNDIEEIALWYNSKKNGLGKEFTNEVRLIVAFLSKRHKIYQERNETIRCAKLKRFPFMIHYLPNLETKQLVILAIIHTSRDTRKWQNKFEE